MIYLYVINSNKDAFMNIIMPPSGLYIIYDGKFGRAIDPHLSPDGTCIAYVINNNLYIQYIFFNIDVTTNDLISYKPIQVTLIALCSCI